MAAHELEFSTFTHGRYVDLMPYQYGREACEPGHAFGPARRDHFLFHYIVSGRGMLMSTDARGAKADYLLSAGEGFLIFPGQVNTYVADLDDPWEYVWVEFDGIRVRDDLEAAGLTDSSPVYRSQSSELRARMVEEMRYLVSNRNASALHLVGHTYLFLDYLLQSVAHPDEQPTSRLQDLYVREAVDFVKKNYQFDITVEDIARQTGLNRSYFGKVFKAATGRSPQQYLISYRMGKAAELLKLTGLPVAEVGRAVGYPNQLHFSRAFKGAYGVSPREWRRENAAV
ncbi:AraC family transcriptional regulator [Olsenella sp. DSM 107455]|uniref:AraC family transcriptional regulator n=1 Tax=Thermophilibacter gallinarum TaxID=2779357 RepID=A0ABR9QSS0_9ACTN|nr:AraC family transcriptional regulator [Thermophilibacter gallinarum]MBE5024134.1 AraC family transcriptional regulator [Thermophilibacter gallinarum]